MQFPRQVPDYYYYFFLATFHPAKAAQLEVKNLPTVPTVVFVEWKLIQNWDFSTFQSLQLLAAVLTELCLTSFTIAT